MKPPITKKVPLIELHHGINITDNYRWLESDSEEVSAWTEEQNHYFRSFLDSIPFRISLEKEFKQLLNFDFLGSYHKFGNKYFLFRKPAGMDHYILFFKDGFDGEERELLNPNDWSPDGSVSLDWWSPNDDGSLVAYGSSRQGDEKSTILVIDVNTMKTFDDERIERSWYGSVAWDNSGFFYTRYPYSGEAPENEGRYHQKVFYHALGTNPKDDVLVFGDNLRKEETHHIRKSSDKTHVIITSTLGTSISSVGNKVSIISLDDPEKKPVLVYDSKDYRTNVHILNGNFYVVTNENSPNYKVFTASLDNPQDQKVIIPESSAILGEMEIVGGKLVCHYLENCSSRIKVFDLSGNFESDIPLPSIGSVHGLNGDYDSPELYFGFSSFTTPLSSYKYLIDKKDLSLLEQIKISRDLNDFIVHQEWSISKDGAKVPFFMVHKKGIPLDGKNPCLMYGYGGFNISMTPSFSVSAIPFLESGGVYVIANIRGGAEFGSEWHKQGMKEEKQNCFNDFISIAEWLIDNCYTSSDKLAIMGGSNGGLLVGAVMVQRPELFKAVVCLVPLLDMLRFDKFLIAKLWVPEYGDPNNKDDFVYLSKYSPYHNVKCHDYPAIFLTAGENDARVHPLHARKMAALLQEVSSNPVLLHIIRKTGHGAGKPLHMVINEITDMWSFIFKELGVKR